MKRILIASILVLIVVLTLGVTMVSSAAGNDVPVTFVPRITVTPTLAPVTPGIPSPITYACPARMRVSVVYAGASRATISCKPWGR